MNTILTYDNIFEKKVRHINNTRSIVIITDAIQNYNIIVSYTSQN